MLEKNPYENGVDIPDFVETKEDDIDMSVFKMSDDELKSNTSSLDFAAEDEYDYDDDNDDEPKRKLSAKGIVLVGGILIAVLLVTTIIGFVFGFSQKGKVAELQAQVETVNAQLVDANNTVTVLQNEITALKEAQKAEQVATQPTGDSSVYRIVSTSGIRVRNAAGATGDSYAKEADCKGLKDINVNEGVIMLSSGAEVNVYETTEVSGATWGRIVNGKDVWICLKMADGSVLAKAQ